MYMTDDVHTGNIKLYVRDILWQLVASCWPIAEKLQSEVSE